MATYIKGVTDVMPSPKAMAPDYGMLSTALSTLQNKYDKGFDQVKTMYSSLINEALSSPDNEKFRSDYLKKADAALSKFSGVDLANPNNVQQATNVFKPLVNDPEYVADLSKTKQQTREYSRLNSIKNSTDEKIRSQYSPIMEAAMNYSFKDMKATKRGDGSIFKSTVQKYIPFTNIQNVLNDAAEKQKLNISVDTPNGPYILTSKNGEMAIPAFNQWARQQLGNTYDEQLLVTGKVAVKRQVESLMNADPNLSKDDAFQQVAKQNSLGIYQNAANYTEALSTGIATIDKKINDFKSQYNGKIPKGVYDEQISQLRTLKSTYQKELADANANKSTKEQQLETSFKQFTENPEYALLSSLKDEVATQWGSSYARTHAESSIKVDTYKLQKDAQQWDKFMSDVKFGRDVYLNDRKAEQDRSKSILEARLKIESEAGMAGGVGTSLAEDRGTSDPYQMYLADLAELQEKTVQNVFNSSVLEVAAGTDAKSFASTMGFSYPTLTKALNTVINKYELYKTDVSKDATYRDSYSKVLTYLRKVNPNIKSINGVSQIVQTISDGTANYKGDYKKYQAATQLLGEGLKAFDDYQQIRNQEVKKRNSLRGSDFHTNEYWDTEYHAATGEWHLRSDLSEAKKNAIYAQTIPNYNKYLNKTAERGTGFTWHGDSEKFNYSAIDNLIKNADYSSILGTDKKDNELSTTVKNLFSESGGELANIFNPDGMVVNKYTIKGQPYLKVSVPLKRNEKGDPITVPGVTGGAITFYVSKENAGSLWKQTTTRSLAGETFNVPTFGDLSQVTDKLFNDTEPVEWLDPLLTNNKAKLPSWMKAQYGVGDGELEFDSYSNKLFFTLKIDNQVMSYPMDITKQQYDSDPGAYSNTISKALEGVLKKLHDAKITGMAESQANHELAVMQNPDQYIDINDIS